MNNIDKYAQLFEMLCDRFDSNNKLGKKATQKMFYFFERVGISLNLRYGMHFYGPYSSRLDDSMHYLESIDIISIDTSGVTHIISRGEEAVSHNALDNEEIKKARFVLDTFAKKTSSELEALATMDFIANYILPESASDADVIDKFVQIKGSKFNFEMVNNTLSELKKLNLVA